MHTVRSKPRSVSIAFTLNKMYVRVYFKTGAFLSFPRCGRQIIFLTTFIP